MAKVRANERGAAAVEFALIVPMLLILVFAIISYGMMLSFRQTLSQAAAEGARAAAVAPKDPPTASFGPTQQAAAAIVNALGSGYACAGGTLTHAGSTVGACSITATGACAVPTTTGPCGYTVKLTYDYKAHPMIPNVPLVPIPDTMTYISSAQGNS